MITVRPYRGDKTGKKWEVDIRFFWPSGEEHRERKKAPVSSKSGALRWAQQREAKLLGAGQPKADVRQAPTLSEAMKTFVPRYSAARGLKTSSAESIESVLRIHVLPHLGDRRLTEITPKHVADLVSVWKAGTTDVKKTTSPKTINNRLSVLKSVLTAVWTWEDLPGSPPNIKLLKVGDVQVPFYEFEEYDKLVAAAGDLDPRFLVMLLLGGDAGLRRGELMALRYDLDVDFRRRQVKVQRAFSRGVEGFPKGVKSRTVPMSDRLAEALKQNRHLRGPRVLHRDDGREVSPKVVRRWMEKIEKAAGMPATGRLHILRHTFCAHLAMTNTPVKTIMELAGHKQLSTTERYMHLVAGAKEDAIRQAELKRAKTVSG